jgi:hypothetical protein
MTRRTHRRTQTVTPDEALAALATLTPPARRFLAALLSQICAVSPLTGLVVEETSLTSMGLLAHTDRGSAPPPAVPLLSDVTVLSTGHYLFAGAIEVAPEERLWQMWWAILTGEEQTFLAY